MDQVDDKNRQEFYRWAQLYGLPEYVKQASPAQVFETHEELPSSVYGDPYERRYCCANKAACYVSNLYFLEKRASLPASRAEEIERRLGQFAQYWGIAADVAALRAKHAALHADGLDELPDSAFAIVWAGEEGRKERHYPLRNPDEVKAAAAWLLRYRDELAFGDRVKIAAKILDRADALGVRLEEEEALQKQAGLGFCDPGEAARLIRERAHAGHRVPAEVRAKMAALAEAVEANPQLAMDLAAMQKLAETIEQFDRSYGLAGKYTERIPRPEDVLFKVGAATIAEFRKQACAVLTGSVYDRQQFAALRPVDVRGLLGDDIAQAVTTGLRVDPEKMAEIAPTLPRPQAEILDRLMEAAGQPPLRKQAAMGLEDAQRQALADDYRRLLETCAGPSQPAPAPSGLR